MFTPQERELLARLLNRMLVTNGVRNSRPAPRRRRLSTAAGDSAMLIPRTRSALLPLEGALLSWGGPAIKNAPTPRAYACLPPEGRVYL